MGKSLVSCFFETQCMLALLCFCVATEFSVNKDLYITPTSAAVDRYLLRSRARPQQQTRRPPPLPSIDGTDGRAVFVTSTPYHRMEKQVSTPLR